MRNQLQNLKNEALATISQAETAEELENLRVHFLGKSGQLNAISRQFKGLDPEARTELGQLFNDVKTSLQTALDSKSSIKDLSSSISSQVDPTLPGIQPRIGLLHPISVVVAEMNSIFQSLGFSVADGPEIETDEYNYTRLNLPMDHPGRDLQDSIYIREPDIVLRTQTSNVEAHILQDCKPPYRFVFPGKCYRYENASASNFMLFHQYQGFAVDTSITLANLKSTLETFIHKFFGPNRKSRFRCKYYPEVEPGVGVDIDCQFCHQKGCSVCKYRGWVEMLGAGMIHPNMLRKVNLDPSKYSGFAWGMGLDRIVMSRYGLNDIRALFNGDLVYKL